MGLETATYISDLVVTNPLGTDAKSQGDDHLRLLKSTIKATFPNITGALSATHTELNYVTGVTSAIQTQINTKGAIAGQAWTGAHSFTGGTITVTTQSAADNSTKAASTAYTDAGLALKGSLAGATWTGTQSFTGATITVPTQLATDNTTKAASTAFVQQVAFSSALPNQTGNGGKYLKTDGSSASWGGAFTGDSGSGGALGLVPAPAAGDSTKYLKGDGTWAIAAFAPDVIVQDQKTSGTSGGSSAGGNAWATHTLNTVVRNNGSVGSLASNQVTLAAGTYLLRGIAAFTGGTITSTTRIRLWNATDSSLVATGQSVTVAASNASGGSSEAVGVVTIAGSKAFSLQYWSGNNAADLNLGIAVSTGAVEVYATLEITKVA